MRQGRSSDSDKNDWHRWKGSRIKEESMQELTFETILRLPQMDLKKH